MERLTKKNYNYESGYGNENKYWCSADFCNKLQQLEDIEEELGIDLITLSKALKSPIVYVKTDEGIQKVYERCALCNEDGVLCVFWAEVLHKGTLVPYHFYLTSYGKDWALTEEELK